MRCMLVVDDERELRSLLGRVFAHQFRVITAEDGVAALRLLDQEEPDVALMDLCMPGMPGLELLPRLKALRPNLPVIVLSALGDIATVLQAMRLGAAHYLTKPFEIDQVKLVVDVALLTHDTAGQAPPLPATPAAVATSPDVDLALPVSLEEEVAKVERKWLTAALTASNGKITRAAQLLRTTPRVVQNRVERYGLLRAGSAATVRGT